MVNEHLDVESHWFETPPFCFRWQHNREREREGKESDRHGGQRGETYLTRGKKRKRRSERPVKDGENTGICSVNFDIIL